MPIQTPTPDSIDPFTCKQISGPRTKKNPKKMNLDKPMLPNLQSDRSISRSHGSALWARPSAHACPDITIESPDTVGTEATYAFGTGKAVRQDARSSAVGAVDLHLGAARYGRLTTTARMLRVVIGR